MQPFIKKLQQSIDYLLSKVTGIEKDVKTLENTVSNLPTSSSGIEISNWVIVNQASDLPATLAANTTYVVVGEITTSQQVTVTNDNASIIGFDRDKDGLTYTGTGNFITVTDVNFSIDNLKISTPNGSPLSASNIDPFGAPPIGGRDKILTITDSQFRGCLNGVSIVGFSMVDISNTLFHHFTGTTGNVFTASLILQISSCEFINWYDEATATTYSTGNMLEIGLPSPFGLRTMNISGCVIDPQQTQNGIVVGAFSQIDEGTIAANTFRNALLTTGEVFLPVVTPGLPNYSVANNTANLDIFANQGLLNSTSGTVMTLIGNTTSTALGGGDPNPNVINTGGGAVQQAGVRYTVSAAGRATYTGSKQAYVSIHASLSFTKQGGGTDDYTFYIYKNGSLLNGSGTDIVSGGATANGQLTMVYGTLMNQNDYIEIYVENVTNTNNMLVKDFQIVIRE